MKRIAKWVLWITIGISIIVQGIIGIKLLDGNYDFITEAYIGAACFAILFLCILIQAFGRKCPHCGKAMHEKGDFCPHYGKRIDEE